MSKPETVSFPVRMPADLRDQVHAASSKAGLSDQDLIRLCIRIGLVDLAAIQTDAAAAIQKAAEDKGASFSAWAEQQQLEEQKATAARSKPSTPGYTYLKPRALNSKLNDEA
jgi:hypothetical protein